MTRWARRRTPLRSGSAIGNEVSMQLNLTDDEARTLRNMLHDYLPALRMEVARTDVRDYRHHLVKRQDLCERLFEELEQTAA